MEVKVVVVDSVREAVEAVEEGEAEVNGTATQAEVMALVDSGRETAVVEVDAAEEGEAEARL